MSIGLLTKEKLKGADVVNVPVLKMVDGTAHELGEMFTDAFGIYAEANNSSYVLFQFPKGKPEEAMPDTANCSNEEYYKLLEVLKGEKYAKH